MFPALHHLRLGARPPPGAARAGSTARGYLSQENEQRCRGLLEASTRRYRQEAVAAAVLVTLCSVGGCPALLYTLRSSTLTGHHKGDVSFPGGKRDSSDQDVIATALRETQEELGLHLGAESVWGVMRPLPTGRGLTVAPVLAHLGPLECVCLSPNPQEVEDVFTIPLAHLLQTQNHGYTHFRHQGRYSHTLPVFLNGRYRVWGLTAIITDLTLELLAPSAYRRRTRPPQHPLRPQPTCAMDCPGRAGRGPPGGRESQGGRLGEVSPHLKGRKNEGGGRLGMPLPGAWDRAEGVTPERNPRTMIMLGERGNADETYVSRDTRASCISRRAYA